MVAAWLLLAAPALAGPAGPTVGAVSDDADRIRGLVDDQIAAFGRDDAQAAWQHVAPGLRAKFGTPDGFLRMVREAYPVVHDAGKPGSSYAFGPLLALPDGAGQVLDITGPEGVTTRALYLLERQPDGTWRTSGCLLFTGDAPLRA